MLSGVLGGVPVRGTLLHTFVRYTRTFSNFSPLYGLAWKSQQRLFIRISAISAFSSSSILPLFPILTFFSQHMTGYSGFSFLRSVCNVSKSSYFLICISCFSEKPVLARATIIFLPERDAMCTFFPA